ncbi:DUF2520 domain-containing protein [Microbacterium terrisoli]|uniref:DUF2520 domain-containing protein n=1 Tax=Microbacterium terrisoli TaxID=3242192 RepID=UPI002804FF78|nr:DUF2520 domain-containing protein [Microbacterium protaetiae]
MQVTVIGAGRVGPVFARALRMAGVTTHGPLRRGEHIPLADVALLCVPDREIRDAAAAATGRAHYLGHTSGATPLHDVDLGVHPLQTFTGEEDETALRGIGAAIAGRTTDAEDVARRLAETLGMRPFVLADADRAAYHAAASVASNFLLTLEAAAERLASAAMPAEQARELLVPLVRTTVENWATLGAASALTGPIARGDEATVARQRDAVAEAAPDLLDLFDTLVAHTRTLAADREDQA